MFQPKAIIVDWDLTICGTLDYAIEKCQRAVAEEGFEVDDALTRRIVDNWKTGGHLTVLLRAIVPAARADQIERMCQFFHKYEKAHPPQLVDGALTILTAYHQSDVPIICITSRDTASLDYLRRHLKVLHLFHHTATEDTVKNHKPHTDAFACTHALLRDLDIELRDCVYVGDAHADYEFGKNIGVTTVIVRTGVYGKHPLEPDMDPAFVIDSIADLPRWLVEHERIAA